MHKKKCKCLKLFTKKIEKRRKEKRREKKINKMTLINVLQCYLFIEKKETGVKKSLYEMRNDKKKNRESNEKSSSK